VFVIELERALLDGESTSPCTAEGYAVRFVEALVTAVTERADVRAYLSREA
jgi:hypothetical protein